MGAGLFAKAVYQVAKVYWMYTALMWELACLRWRSLGVHIRYLGNGFDWFRPYGGSLLNSAKVSKTLLPHHSAPRLGSVCPLSGLNPWAAAMGHPWPSAANPASCRVTHGSKPAFGQRGLTGRLRSRSQAKSKARANHYPPSAWRSKMWELACLRWRRVSQLIHWLIHRHRRQARSHIWSADIQ